MNYEVKNRRVIIISKIQNLKNGIFKLHEQFGPNSVFPKNWLNWKQAFNL